MTVDDLSDYGMVRMDDEEIRGFLSSQSVGVLGLPTAGAPSLRPMSFAFDGESRLYFLYVLGSGSRKRELTDRAEVARFLVYRAETRFNWRSVLLTGTIGEVPEDEREDVLANTEIAWRPDLFERAGAVENTALYAFRIEERTGIKHTGLPPGFEDPADEPAE
jgi:hypothetical protein